MSSQQSATITAAAATFGLVAVSIYFLVVGRDVLVPLVLGLFIAYLIIALAHAIGRVRIGAWSPAPWQSLSTSIFGLLIVLVGLVELIAGNIGLAVEAAPLYQTRFEQLLSDLNNVLAASFGRKEGLSLTSVVEQIDLRSLAGKFAAALQSVVANTFEIAIYVVFALLEHRTLDRKLTAVFPEPGPQQTVRAALGQIGSRIEAYVLIKTLVSLMVAAATYVILTISGVDFAAFLALLVFLLNFIPYVGAAIGVVLPSLLALLQFGSVSLMAIVAGALVVAFGLIGNFIEPRLLGRSLNLSPLLMIVSLAAWGEIWGVTGMLLSVPLMVMLMIALGQFPRTRPIAVFMSESGDKS
ncbi:MAG: AI-2E family transporter [Rhodospirillaceae bacterium]|nr:AI-2E family transporter [Rhodospirillaceae bacterium]